MNAGLYCKMSKSTFGAREIELGYVVSVSTSKSRLNTILLTRAPGHKGYPAVHRIRKFIPSFYPQVLDRHGQHATGGKVHKKKVRKLATPIDPHTSERHEHLLRTQGCIVDAVNDHLNPDRKTKVETAASGFAISGILSQLDESNGNWVSVAFYSRKSRFASLRIEFPTG